MNVVFLLCRRTKMIIHYSEATSILIILQTLWWGLNSQCEEPIESSKLDFSVTYDLPHFVSDTPIQKLLEFNGTVYVGATNKLYALSKDLKKIHEYHTGPVHEGHDCSAPDPCSGCKSKPLNKNNTNMALLMETFLWSWALQLWFGWERRLPSLPVRGWTPGCRKLVACIQRRTKTASHGCPDCLAGPLGTQILNVMSQRSREVLRGKLWASWLDPSHVSTTPSPLGRCERLKTALSSFPNNPTWTWPQGCVGTTHCTTSTPSRAAIRVFSHRPKRTVAAQSLPHEDRTHVLFRSWDTALRWKCPLSVFTPSGEERSAQLRWFSMFSRLHMWQKSLWLSAGDGPERRRGRGCCCFARSKTRFTRAHSQLCCLPYLHHRHQ